MRIERLLDGLQIEGAQIRANEQAVFDQASGVEERIATRIFKRDQNGHGADTIDRTLGTRNLDRALGEIGIGGGCYDGEFRTCTPFDLESAFWHDSQEGGEAVNLTRNSTGAVHDGRIRAVSIVSHDQWGAGLALSSNELVDRNRFTTRTQGSSRCVLEGHRNNGLRVRSSRHDVAGNG